MHTLSVHAYMICACIHITYVRTHIIYSISKDTCSVNVQIGMFPRELTPFTKAMGELNSKGSNNRKDKN